jgi:hypothetical protein
MHGMSIITIGTTSITRSTPADADVTSKGGCARRLRQTLRVNALTSGIGGLVAAIAADRVATALGTDSPGWVRAVGIALVLFGVDVAAASMLSDRRLASITPWISAVDIVWVAATVVAIVLGWFSVSGALVVAGVGAVVAVFGVRQLVLSHRVRGRRP